MFNPTFMDTINEQSSENFLNSAGEYESLKTIETNFQEPVNELIKSLSWIDHDRVQTYDGELLNSNLHGDGRYIWRNNILRPLTESIVSAVYEGTFYANAKEGYGLLSYKDNSTFEGLFKAGQPFGPGVFTESNGSQNVGIWRGSRLYRIYKTVDSVPKLADSSGAKIKLMKYRRLVPSSEEDCNGLVKDFAKLVLAQMGASETTANNLYPKLFNPDARSPKSLFLDQDLHEKAYFKTPKIEDDAALHGTDVDSSRSDHTTESTKPTPYLVAWNNEPFMLEVLSHVYRNRSFEADVSFSVDTLVTGQRKRWRSRGDHEEVSLSYLKAAADGAKEQVQRIVTFFALDENVSDARGNNAVHLAAAEDHHDVVKYVVREGANVNQQNDEGLTPLTLSLARYVAVRRRSGRWELAFLPPPSEFFAAESHPDLIEWNMRRSKTSIVSGEDDVDDDTIEEIFKAQLEKAGGKLTADLVVPERKYLLSLRPLMVLPERKDSGDKKKKKGKGKKADTEQPGGEKKERRGSKKKEDSKEDKKSKKKDKSEKSEVETTDGGKSSVVSETEFPPIDPNALTDDEIDLLAKIETTIDVLLNVGADPNVGQAPSTPLVLALCAANVALVEKLLRRGANPRAATLGHGFGLTPLHLVCLLRPREENAELARLLVAYGADPHAAADVAFNVETRRLLLTGLDDNVDVADERGMTPLHALALRPDFRHGVETASWLGALIGVVVATSGVPASRHGYLGHSPLSLAAFRGDLDVAGALLATGAFDPNETLGRNLGNVLAVIAALRSFELVPVATRIKMCDLLIAHGVDPLRKITLDGGEFCGNIVDFCCAEVRKEIDKQPNPKKPSKELTLKLKEYKKLTSVLLERAKERLVRGVLGRLVVALAGAAREALDATPSCHDLAAESVRLLASQLTEWELVRGLVLLSEARQIAPTQAQAELMVAAVADANQARATFTGPTEPEMLEYVAPFLRADDEAGDIGVVQTLPAFTRSIGPFVMPPELDENACTPTACFECGRTDAKLEVCPRCGLVAFCSKACNKSNLGRRGPLMHRCANAFVGAKDAATLPIIWAQLWKSAKGKDKESKKAKGVGNVGNPKIEFFKSLDFNDGRDYQELPEENVDIGIGEEAEAVVTEQGDETVPAVFYDYWTESTETKSNDIKTAEGKHTRSCFRNSGGKRFISRKPWEEAESAQVTKNLLKVSLRLARKGNFVEQKQSTSESNAFGWRLFSCSDEKAGSSRLFPGKNSGSILRGSPPARVSVDQTVRLPGRSSFFEETSNALSMMAPTKEVSSYKTAKTASSNNAKQTERIEPTQAEKANRIVERNVKKSKRQQYGSTKATHGNRSPRFEGKFPREAVVGDNGRSNSSFVCRVKTWESSWQEWDGKRRLEAVQEISDEYFPVQALFALLKFGEQGISGLKTDLFLLPYAIYKDGDLYYCVKDPPSSDNSSLI